MKRWLLALLLCALTVPCVAQRLFTTQATYYWNTYGLDKFAYSNGNLAGNGNWVSDLGSDVTLSVVSNTIECSSIGSSDCNNQYNVAFPNDQCSRIHVNTLNATSSGAFSAWVRATLAGAENGYAVAVHGPLGSTATMTIYKYVGGTRTTLVSATTETINSGDDVGICAQGTSIYATLRGAQPSGLTTTDSSVTAGVPAIGIYSNGQAQTDVILSNWSAFYIGTTPPTAGGGAPGVPFPRLGLQLLSGSITIGGGQCFPTGTSGVNDSIVAQFDMVVIGGNDDNWTSQCTPRTRQATVAAIKGYTKTGVHAVTPKVFQYQNSTELCQPGCAYSGGPWFAAWETAVSDCNWWTYLAGSSGTLAESIYVSSLNVVDPAHVVGADTGCYTNSGLYPNQLMASLWYGEIIAGPTGSGVGAAPNLDGVYFDNLSVRGLASTNADWLRTGTAQNVSGSGANSTAVNAINAGKADIPNWFAANAPSYLVAINSEASYDMSNSGGLDMTSPPFNNLSGLVQYAMQQFFWGSFNSPNNACSGDQVLGFGGFTSAVNWYQILSAYSTVAPLLTGCVNPGATGSDAQLVRWSLGFVTVVGNGYAFYGTCNQDINDYSQSCAALPSFDEFFGGTTGPAGNTAGWLGQPVDAPQTAAYSNGVWVRRFTGGLVAVNGTGTGFTGSGCPGGSSETITLPSGGPWYPLHGANSVNGGGSAVTSVTIPACDARFYSTIGPNYRPSVHIGGDSRLESHATRPAANDDYFVRLLKDAV